MTVNLPDEGNYTFAWWSPANGVRGRFTAGGQTPRGANPSHRQPPAIGPCAFCAANRTREGPCAWGSIRSEPPEGDRDNAHSSRHSESGVRARGRYPSLGRIGLDGGMSGVALCSVQRNNPPGKPVAFVAPWPRFFGTKMCRGANANLLGQARFFDTPATRLRFSFLTIAAKSLLGQAPRLMLVSF